MRILKRDLKMRAYKIQVQPLKPPDRASRVTYGREMLRVVRREPDMSYRLIMGDEAHFDLTGGVFNQQNVRFWGTEQPRVTRERDPHALRLAVWCGVTALGVLGPYFFEDERGRTLSVNGERYRAILRD